LDWLKWDNSGLPGPVCNRADHGHQATDGALAALKGQYEIWEYLHRRFPRLILEECGYPSRLDYGLARNVQAHWLADSTQPALQVRQNQLHASYVFPAAHNEAWVIRCREIEDAKDPVLLDTLVRSRMIGLFGIGTLTGKLTERASLYPKEVLDALKRNIAVYKQYRHLLREDVYHILPPTVQGDAWDAIQFCKRDGSESVLIAFRSNSPDAKKVLPLRGLMADATYDAKSYNGGPPHALSGRELAGGLTIELPRPEMSEVIHLKRRSVPAK
jgi:alpha-galactosidase